MLTPFLDVVPDNLISFSAFGLELLCLTADSELRDFVGLNYLPYDKCLYL